MYRKYISQCILILGRSIYGGDALSSCQILKGGRWISQPPMRNKRRSAAACVSKDGDFVVTGGTVSKAGGGFNSLSSTEIFKNGEWQTGPALPKTIYHHCMVATEKGVIVAGEHLNA